MKTGEDVARARGLKFEDYKDGVPAEAFANVGLPLIVHCTGCEETLSFPASLVDADGRIWCEDCGDPSLEEPPDLLLAFIAGLVASLSAEERKAAFESPEWLAIDEGKRGEFLAALEKELPGRRADDR